ncbi:MAG: aldehyde dehydrogenase family protein, partial [Burkholderiaceae bacterium]|nr:aldehyde dehydrogenase family protein [Burkholderiaceae bacterium]
MNDPNREAQQSMLAIDRVQRLFAAQRAACLKQPFPTAAERRARLQSLKRQLQRYQDRLAEAMSQDFGFRPAAESKMLDLLGSVLEANHALSHLGRWMKSSRRSTELLFLGNHIEVRYQPKGVVGVIVPWNFPIYLAIGPLVTALA